MGNLKMAQGAKSGGLIAALIITSIITIGGVTAVAVINWPNRDQGKQPPEERQLEALAKSAGIVCTKIVLDFSDPMEQQFALEKSVKDLRENFPEIKQVWVVSENNSVIYSTKSDDIEKPYQPPAGVKIVDPAKIFMGQISPQEKLVSVPLKIQNKVLGGLRMIVSLPQVPASGGDRNMVVIAGAVAMILGLIMPVVLVSVMGGGAARVPAGSVVDPNTLRALKAEEASINARLEAARKDLSKAEELKSQQNFIESQIEAMRKLQFEEAHRLEGLKKEAAELAAQIEQKRSLMSGSPQERMADLTREEQELLQKIEGHRKEEVLLARKIEEIRKKVIDLDRRIEARRKEEAEIGIRIEAKRKQEQALDQKLGS